MRVHIIAFGVLKDWLGGSALALELHEGATAGDLLSRIKAGNGGAAAGALWNTIAISVNAEYASLGRVLRDGDEVGLLPPVSGGSDDAAAIAEQPCIVALTREAIIAECFVQSAKGAADGAVVTFEGIVRNHSRGRRTLYLDYEAYEAMALKQMNELAEAARAQFGVSHITMIHRLGRIFIGETSVLIVVAAPHRAQAYEASRWLIDTLKKTVPIWKKETFVDGAVWADGEPFPSGMGVASAEVQLGG